MTPRTHYSSEAQERLAQARAAIRSHNYVVLNLLLMNGLNPNMPASDGRYLVHDAVLLDADGTSVDILYHYHADMNARWDGYLNWTPAHIAWFSGRADIVEKLRRLGANLGLTDSRGWSASHALPCPITRIEAARKLGPMASIIGHTHQNQGIYA